MLGIKGDKTYCTKHQRETDLVRNYCSLCLKEQETETPNQQLFTVAKVKDFLQEQRQICAKESKVRYVNKKVNLSSQAKSYKSDDWEETWTVDEEPIVNAPEPQSFIDRIITETPKIIYDIKKKIIDRLNAETINPITINGVWQFEYKPNHPVIKEVIDIITGMDLTV